MESLDNEVQKEIDNFKEILPCKEKHKQEGKVCLPAYLILQKIEFDKLNVEEVRQIVSRGVSLYNRLAEKGKKKHFDNFYRFINDRLKELLYPGETNVKWECENANCPAYSIIRAVEGGNGFSEYMTVQYAAIDVFKHKVGETEHKDIGFENAIFRWTQDLITVDGKATNRAAEYSRAYKKNKVKKVMEFLENHKNILTDPSKRKLIEKIIGKI